MNKDNTTNNMRPPTRQQHHKDRDNGESECNNVILRKILDEIELCQQTDNKAGDAGGAWNALGLIRFYTEHDIPGAIQCFEKALTIYRDCSQSSVPVAVTFNDLAKCYEELNQSARALELYQEAVRLLEKEEVTEAHPALLSGRRSSQRLSFLMGCATSNNVADKRMSAPDIFAQFNSHDNFATHGKKRSEKKAILNDISPICLEGQRKNAELKPQPNSARVQSSEMLG